MPYSLNPLCPFNSNKLVFRKRRSSNFRSFIANIFQTIKNQIRKFSFVHSVDHNAIFDHNTASYERPVVQFFISNFSHLC